MASRKDFAKKKRSSSSGNSSRAKQPGKNSPAKKRFPTLLLATTLLFVAGLGFSLYKLTRVEAPVTPTETSTKTVAKTKPAPAKTTSKKKEDAPHVEDRSDDRFQFYDMLKESEVTSPPVEAYKSTPKDPSAMQRYLLQAGSFKSKADAEQMRAQLILLGLPNVHTNQSKSESGQIWYRVRLGPFESRSQLSKAYDKLVQQNIQPLRIKLK